MNICTDDEPFPKTQQSANPGAQFTYVIWLMLKDPFSQLFGNKKS